MPSKNIVISSEQRPKGTLIQKDPGNLISSGRDYIKAGVDSNSLAEDILNAKADVNTALNKTLELQENLDKTNNIVVVGFLVLLVMVAAIIVSVVVFEIQISNQNSQQTILLLKSLDQN